MKTFTFALMEQIQRTDGALRIERARAAPDRLKLIWLGRLRKRLAARLRRSLAAIAPPARTTGA